MDNVMAPQAITRSADHRYRKNDGPWVPGVTGILDAMGVRFDIASRYGANQCAAHVADLIERGVIVDMFQSLGAEAFKKGIASTAIKKRDEAAAVGTEIHRLAELVVQGKPTPPMAEGLRSRVLALADWWQASGWTVRLTEAMVINMIKDDYGYGGTFDLLARDRDGRTILADYKTGNLYPKVAIQLAGYSMASEVMFTDGKVYPMPAIDRYVILHVTLDGVREVELSIGTAERMAFLACLDLWHWSETMKGKRL